MAGRAVEAHLSGDEGALGRFDTERCRNYETYLNGRQEVYAGETRFTEAAFWRRRAAPIDLSPDTRLTLSSGVRSLRHVVGSPLSAAEREAVVALCDQPRAASELARGLTQMGHWQRAHGRLILGLQDLVERGLLTH